MSLRGRAKPSEEKIITESPENIKTPLINNEFVTPKLTDRTVITKVASVDKAEADPIPTLESLSLDERKGRLFTAASFRQCFVTVMFLLCHRALVD